MKINAYTTMEQGRLTNKGNCARTDNKTLYSGFFIRNNKKRV